MLSHRMFNPFTPDFARDPYPAYAALRAQGGTYYSQDLGLWLLSRFDDVNAAALDRSLVRVMAEDAQAAAVRRRAQDFHDMPMHERFVQRSMLDSEGETHDRLRRLVLREFSPAAIARLKAATQAHVDRLMDMALERRELDFVEDFAAAIPGVAIGRMLGADESEAPLLRRWSEDIVQFFDPDRTPEKKLRAETATGAFRDYLQGLATARRAQPRDDILSRLVAAQDAGLLDGDEVISLAMLILMAGHGSSLDVMGSGLNALLTFPDQMARLRADPTLMPTAVQEMFRFESPLPFFHRHVTQPVMLGGRVFAPGETVGLLYGAANRDGDAFPDPDRFDVGRAPNRHLAFGGGTHFCLGNHLARLTLEVVFTALVTRTRSITLCEPPVWRSGLSARGPLCLRVAFTA